jgi:hypothetical protein
MVKTQKRNKSKIRSKKTKFLRKKKFIGGVNPPVPPRNNRKGLLAVPQAPPRHFRPPIAPPRLSIPTTVLGTKLPQVPTNNYELPFMRNREYVAVNNGNNSAYASNMDSMLYESPAPATNLYERLPGNENFPIPQSRVPPEISNEILNKLSRLRRRNNATTMIRKIRAIKV